MFIVDITYMASLDLIDEHLQAHRDFLETQYQKGVLLASGPKNPRTGGIIIALHAHRNELDEMLQQDPFFKAGLAHYEITEFSPVKYCTEIKNLI